MTKQAFSGEGKESHGRCAPADLPRLSPLLSCNAVLHHLGFVVASISASADEFAECMGAQWNGQIIHDPLQQVRVTFLVPSDLRNPVFELVEPADPASPVTRFVKQGGGLHHICYEVDGLEAALNAARAAHFVIVSSPKPAVAFNGRKIAWVFSRNRLLVEFLERAAAGNESG